MIHIEHSIGKCQNPLDYPITENELIDKIQALKNKKASGPDGILKNTEHKLRLALLKLFNLVLSVGHFPEAWNRGLIMPIFKSGDKSDPNNYRGICVSSDLGKLFCSIINTRLVHFLTEHDVLSKSLTDHIFTLSSSSHLQCVALIDKYINQNKNKIFATL